MQKESLATIVEENESEISSPTPNQTESKEFAEQIETNSEFEDDEMSENMISIHSKTYSIDSNASSYRCFKEIVMSSSSVFNHPLYFFPDLEDPGIQDAISFETAPILEDECQKYKDLCKDLEIYPISRVCKSLCTRQLNLKYYVPIEKQMKAICKTLERNQFIEELNLQDNWLSVESCSYLMNLLGWNRTLKILKLKECRIGPEGMATLSETLGSGLIEDLDLSFNSLGDEGLKKGMYSLADNQKLKKLNLSHNELTGGSAVYLNVILTTAGALEELDLTWNSFNTPKSMKILCDGFKNAECLRWLSLAWNGISSEQTALPLLQYIRKNLILEYLDLSNNLLKGTPLTIIMKGVSESNSLKHVKIGNNIFSPEQAYSCAQFLAKPRKRPLKLLDMENMVVQKIFLNLLERIREQKKDVIHGTVLANYEIYGPYIPKVLFERCRYLGMKPKKKKKRADFGQLVLSLPNQPITSTEFQSILVAKKLKSLLDYDLVTAVENHYKIKKSQKINCAQLVNDYMMLYPDTELAPRKKKKLKRGKASRNRKNKSSKDKQRTKSKPEDEKVSAIIKKKYNQLSSSISKNVNDASPPPMKDLEMSTSSMQKKFSVEGKNSITLTQKKSSHTNAVKNTAFEEDHENTMGNGQPNPLTASGVFIFDDTQ